MNPQNIKSYAADSMREALVMVRKDLGPDALIVSQETQGRKVLLKATLEEWSEPVTVSEARQPQPGLKQSVAQNPDDASVAVSRSERPSGDPDAEAGTEVNADQAQLAPRELLLDDVVTLDPRATTGQAEPPVAQASSTLDPAALSYPFAALTLDQLQGRLRFVGASGVGKTSLLIKLLVEWVMVNGPADALVVANDNHRLGASESLQLTCQLLGVEIVQASPRTDRTATQAKRLVLIDSSACELEAIRPEPGVRDIVVLSALHSSTALKGQLDSLKGQQTACLGLTHVDQIFARDELAGFLHNAGLTPALIGSSAYLPGGIEIASETALSRVLGLTDA